MYSLHVQVTCMCIEGREDRRRGLQGLEDRLEDTATFFPNLQCQCMAVRFRFSRRFLAFEKIKNGRPCIVPMQIGR